MSSGYLPRVAYRLVIDSKMEGCSARGRASPPSTAAWGKNKSLSLTNTGEIAIGKRGYRP